MTLDFHEDWERDSLSGPVIGGASALRSRAPRMTKVMLAGKLVAGGSEQLCRVLNISVGGLMMSTAAPVRPRQVIRIELKSGRELTGTTVWSDAPYTGVQFEAPIDIEQILSHDIAGRSAHAPRAPRVTANRVVLVRSSGRTLPGHLLDLSQGGAKVRLAGALAPGDQLSLTAPPHPPALGTVRWVRGMDVGISFFEPLSFGQVAQWLADRRLASE